MKEYYLDNMLKNMTEGEKELLQMIYEPRVVAIPPCDACKNLCVTPEGEIRIYGKLNKKHPEDGGTFVYASSYDGGMSWKTCLEKRPEVLGSAGYNPHTGRYIASYPNEYRPELTQLKGHRYPCAVLSDEGFDGVNNRYVKLSDKEIHILKRPFFLESCSRWFILGEYTDEQHVKYATVSYSDDDGENWTTNILKKTAPAFETVPPHEGTRWQQYTCEPTVVETDSGELLMLVRTSQNYHYMYRSRDCGETWSDPEPSVFHGTITMPVLHKLSDGRILFFWCNNEPMPELDHEITWPRLSENERAGIWEDVFTNRDANHLAISEDGGRTWRGMRELFLNTIRNNADFRSVGGANSRDKSVHQAELLELPFNKLLVYFGQNVVARKVMILDLDWLYEQERHEDFRLGLSNLTTHMYVKSNLGGFRTFSGHCAYNRTDGALLVPDPDGNFEEVLQLCRPEDERLVYQKQGAVWNFPASARGTVTVKLRVLKSGVALSLSDHWYNACDETVRQQAPVSVDITKEMCGAEGWTEVRLDYNLQQPLPKTVQKDCRNRAEGAAGTTERSSGTAVIRVGKEAVRTVSISGEWPNGFSYLHIQTLAEERDMEGTLIKELHQCAEIS